MDNEKMITIFKDFDVPESTIIEWGKMLSDAAYRIDGWVQDAVGDLAQNLDIGFDFFDEKWKKKIEKAKSYGVLDLKGWLADEYYSDPDTIQDLIGDRVYDEATTILGNCKEPAHTLMCDCILETMKEKAHGAMVTAIDNILKQHKEYLERRNEAEKLQ